MTKLVETEIPDWAEWVAQDSDGQWYAYERKPRETKIQGDWWPDSGAMVKCGDSGKENPNWRTTLHNLEEK